VSNAANPPPFDGDALPVADALQRIGALVAPVSGEETIDLSLALDRILAAAVISAVDVPSHDNAAMDGYSFASADLQAGKVSSLPVVGEAFAGRPFEGLPPAASAIRVMTGAVMPPGHDTVVAQELVEREADIVRIPAGQTAGQNRRLRGEDLERGKPALTAGQRLGPAELGLLASLGMNNVTVRRRLRVAILSTGDELQAPGSMLQAGQIFDSNRYTLAAMLTRMGVEVIDLGIVRDDPIALERTLREASGKADAIISSAGVSVGEADFTRTVMAKLGTVDFCKIAMRPGRPLAFGQLGRALYFGLPGNPVAVMITFVFLVRDALLAMAGARAIPRPTIKARAGGPIRKRAGRTEYQRALLERDRDGIPVVRLMPNQGSAVLSSMSLAHCIVVLEHERASVAQGDWVDCVPMDLLT
jgi:molybdopterin molybdotransferase